MNEALGARGDPVFRKLSWLLVGTLIVLAGSYAVGAKNWANDTNQKVTVLGTSFENFRLSFEQYRVERQIVDHDRDDYRKYLDGQIINILNRLTALETQAKGMQFQGQMPQKP